MSWASRRRTVYAGGVTLFFVVVLGVPLAIWLYEPPACFDGKQNQGEMAPDKGGPCVLLDERTLTPHAVLWSRALPVRGGLYSAVAYIENPNTEAGVRSAEYLFTFYDERNILVAERRGETFIMPGGITPVFEGAIETGNRAAVRTHFEFTAPLVWERMADTSHVLEVSNKVASGVSASPRLEATVENTSVSPLRDPVFVAVIFDPAGNASAASATTLGRLDPGEKGTVVFTWPDPFSRATGRIDVLPLVPPVLVQ